MNVAARLESVAEVNGLYMSYETYAHVQDMVDVEQKRSDKDEGNQSRYTDIFCEGKKGSRKRKDQSHQSYKTHKERTNRNRKIEKKSEKLEDESRKS